VIIDFILIIPQAIDQQAEQERVSQLLQENGYQLVHQKDGRVLLERYQPIKTEQTRPCSCNCNFKPKMACGGCGHAGCGWRSKF
jgi:hypothetical protein